MMFGSKEKKRDIAGRMSKSEGYLDVDAISPPKKMYNAGVSSKTLHDSEALRLAASMSGQGWTYARIVNELIRKGATREMAESAAAPYK